MTRDRPEGREETNKGKRGPDILERCERNGGISVTKRLCRMNSKKFIKGCKRGGEKRAEEHAYQRFRIRGRKRAAKE